jgi:hypothetical protein
VAASCLQGRYWQHSACRADNGSTYLAGQIVAAESSGGYAEGQAGVGSFTDVVRYAVES